jgi:hypothetical protein
LRKLVWAGLCAAAAFTAAGEARADWGLHTGDTLRPGDNMLYGEVGWPDFSVGFQHGMTDIVDLGVRVSLIYGNEYTPHTQVGLGVRVPIRITPLQREKFSLQIHVDPGLKFDAFRPVYFGLWLPFGVEVGIHVTREATVAVGMDVPFYLNFTNPVSATFPFLAGPGFEYHVNEHVAVGAHHAVRAGRLRPRRWGGLRVRHPGLLRLPALARARGRFPTFGSLPGEHGGRRRRRASPAAATASSPAMRCALAPG